MCSLFRKMLSGASSHFSLITPAWCFGYLKYIPLVLVVGLLSSCGGRTIEQAAGGNGTPAGADVADLQIVDCLLPGQVRRLGSGSYVTPRRPVHTTASDCRIRGGEYVAYDRADYRTALNVWMPAAEGGDAEAQANVGEIFERGLGGEPNYEAAAIWYAKAAEQGNSRAQFNLGTLYEQGLGVEKSKLVALNWYRKAWGLEEDSLIYQSAAAREQQEVRDQLVKEIKQKETQIALLNHQITDLESGAQAVASAEQQEQLNQLETWIGQLEEERLLAMSEVDQIPRYREPEAPPTLRLRSGATADDLRIKDMNFGKYYALIIGNQNYDAIEDLRTPYSDATRAKQLLETQYGFDVTVLLDADNASIMRAINNLNEVLTEEDNLLIFYAGHGSRIKSGEYEAGYWLPVNANPPPDDTFWVSNEFVTRHLARLKAKRVMVVADSCYAGLLSTAPGYLLLGDKAEFSEDYIRYKMPKKSRLLLSSGGDQPVLDNVGQGHSIFASAFLTALENSSEIITGPQLFLKIRDIVTSRAKSIGVEQTPEFKAIKGAGHEVGDFFFVRKGSL